MVLIVVIGVLPAPFLDRIKPPLVPIVEHLQPNPVAPGRPGEARSLPRHADLSDRPPPLARPPPSEVRPSMTAIENARQTLLILLPEILILLCRHRHDDGRGVRQAAAADLVDRVGGDARRRRSCSSSRSGSR